MWPRSNGHLGYDERIIVFQPVSFFDRSLESVVLGCSVSVLACVLVQLGCWNWAFYLIRSLEARRLRGNLIFLYANKRISVHTTIGQ
jgi:hypothetical protein